MLKVVFLGNYFNHHQRYLSDALAQRCEYTFISTVDYNEKRLKLGWKPEPEPEYVVHYDRQQDLAERRLREADAVLTGSAPEELVRGCIRRGQLVLRYAERPLKKGNDWKKYIPRLIKWHLQNPARKPVYMLCASAYTASDYAKFGLFRGKTYKWGYFPQVKDHGDGEELMAKKIPGSILWAGRFLDWKHPDDAVRLAAKLKQEGFDFHLTILGSGELEQQLRDMILQAELSDRVSMPGAASPEQVRAYMEKSEIFLFTSDRQEGWGVVANEAMNSGCCVAASRDAGSAPYLIQDGENGVLYAATDVETLYQKVKALLDDPEKRRKMGLRGYETIRDCWNPRVAAQRLLTFIEHNCRSDYQEGPCSKA